MTETIEKKNGGNVGAFFMSGLLNLFITFFALKMGGVIDMSWWWVTFPLWAIPMFYGVLIGAVFLVLILVVGFIIMGRSIRGIGNLFRKMFRSKNPK